jgi:hypothetical protein
VANKTVDPFAKAVHDLCVAAGPNCDQARCAANRNAKRRRNLTVAEPEGCVGTGARLWRRLLRTLCPLLPTLGLRSLVPPFPTHPWRCRARAFPGRISWISGRDCIRCRSG